MAQLHSTGFYIALPWLSHLTPAHITHLTLADITHLTPAHITHLTLAHITHLTPATPAHITHLTPAHITHLIHKYYFFLVRYLLWLGELVEPSPWLEDQSVVLDERTNVTSLVHI